MNVTRLARRRLWSGPGADGPSEAVRTQRTALLRSISLVRVFYGASALWIVEQSSGWPRLLDVEAMRPQWPAAWIDDVGLDRGVPLVLIGYSAATLVAALAPQWRLARLAYAVGLLQYMAIENGFGKINHSYHAWLVASLVLVALPARPWGDDRPVRSQRYFTTVLWTAQFWLLFVYTLTGLWKLYYAVVALGTEQISAFSFHGFSYITADRISATDQTTLLGDFVIRNEHLGWALFLATIYIESAAVIVAFRPRLHRLWGVALIGFHVGTMVALGFSFRSNIVLLALLLIGSPFAPDRLRWTDAVRDLPGVHAVSRRLGTSRSSRRRAPDDVAATTDP